MEAGLGVRPPQRQRLPSDSPFAATQSIVIDGILRKYEAEGPEALEPWERDALRRYGLDPEAMPAPAGETEPLSLPSPHDVGEGLSDAGHAAGSWLREDALPFVRDKALPAVKEGYKRGGTILSAPGRALVADPLVEFIAGLTGQEANLPPIPEIGPSPLTPPPQPAGTHGARPAPPPAPYGSASAAPAPAPAPEGDVWPAAGGRDDPFTGGTPLSFGDITGDPGTTQSHVAPVADPEAVDSAVEEMLSRDQTGTFGTRGPRGTTRTSGASGSPAGLADDAQSSKNWLQRVLRPDDPDDRRSLAQALMAGGRAMASAPGDALEGLSAGMAGGMDAYYGSRDVLSAEDRKDAELDLKRELTDLKREEAAADRRNDALAAEAARVKIQAAELELEQLESPGLPAYDPKSPLGKIKSDVERYARELVEAGIPEDEAVERALREYERYKGLFDPEDTDPLAALNG